MKKILVILLAFPFTLHAQVKIIAHRGASYDAPENTRVSVNLAWQKGADAAEVDIYLTADGRIVCIHDANTKRTSGKNIEVAEANYQMLQTLDVGSFKSEKYKGEKIPLLDDIVAALPRGKELVVELKARMKLLPALKKIIDEEGINKNISFICFDLATITATKKNFPDRQCVWLCNDIDSFFANIDKINSLSLDGVSLRYSIIDSSVVSIVKKHHLKLFAYTVNDEKEMVRLVQSGVAGITTDRPDLLLAHLPSFQNKHGEIVDSRDNKVYKTITIGSQTWLAENLAFHTSSGSFAYKTDEKYEAEYGRLYTLEAAENACPSGWRLPSKEEWDTLILYLGGSSVAGGKLKSLDKWLSPNTGATDESGFAAIPAGSRYHSDGSFNNLGDHACFWSSSKFGDMEGWFFYVNHDRNNIYRNRLRNTSGFSVRCVRDK
ncbi:MAG: FISUMP domain-containing protein [Bacteroidota bacterium]|nr:FISUMP domain-containing protein [Bacteroidota bacterium]